jgi:hypothetical protein
MKTAIIFWILLLPSILWGQITNHFNNSDSKWHVAKTNPAGNQLNPSFVATTTSVFGFQDDSTLNNEQWLKLYSTNDSLFQNDLVYRGLLRAENSKVFYLDTLNQLDILYDFSLSVGDSVLFDLYGMYPEWLQVIDVDSIQINGDYYRRQKFAEPTIQAFDELNEVWIEGIGSIHGPLFPVFPIKFSQEIPDSMLVTCSYSDNQQVWQHPSYTNCYINIVLGIDRIEVYDFKLYPNPFLEKIHFENNKQEKFDLSISNNNGQLVKQIQLLNDNETIDLSELSEGIYFLTFSGEKGVETVKMIKKD